MAWSPPGKGQVSPGGLCSYNSLLAGAHPAAIFPTCDARFIFFKYHLAAWSLFIHTYKAEKRSPLSTRSRSGSWSYHTDLYFVRWAEMLVCVLLEVQEVWRF